MKKFSILLAIILVSVLGQSTLAKSNVSLNGAFMQTGYNSHWGVPSLNGFSFGIAGEYELTSSFSITGEFAVSKISNTQDWNTQIATFFYKPSFYLKYSVFNLDNINLGVQIGASDVFSKINNENETIIHNFFYIGAGIYAGAYIVPGLQIYTSLKMPIVIIATDSRTYSEGERYVNTLIVSPLGSRGAGFIDLKIGVGYDVQPEVSLGIEGRINNLGPICYECYRTQHYSYYDNSNSNLHWNYSIGAKVTYKF